MTIPSGKTRRVVLCVYGAALLYFILKLVYCAFWVGGTPDEPQHVGYLAEITRNPALIPDFVSMPMYGKLPQIAGQMTVRPAQGTVNYLGHPPLYYLFMSLFGAVSFPGDGTALVDVTRLRIVNMVLSSAAVVLAFRIGYRKIGERSPVYHLLYAAAIVTLPMLGYVSSGISNDNLVFLGFAVFFSGIVRYDEGKLDFPAYLLIGVGFLLGAFSKLTAALVMLIMLVAILVMSVIRTKSLKLVANKWFLLTLPCYLLFLAYEIIIYRRYGAFQPTLANLPPEFFRTTNFYVAPENRVAMTLLQYARHFLGGIGYTWSSIYGHNEAVTAAMNNRQAGVVYWIPVAAALAAAVVQAVRKNADRFTIPAAAGFLGTLAYHFYNGWSGFLKNGYTGGNQARYYLFLIIPFALAFAGFLPEAKTKKAKAILTVLAVLLVALWVLGDAPRLLLAGIPATA